MIYVGASPVIIQAMLGGQAGVGAGGGPPLVTNILQGGDILEVATTVPYAIQSLIVSPEIERPRLDGKKIGISRLGAIPHYTLQAIFKLHNLQGVNIVQTGTTTQAIASLSQGCRRHHHLGAVHVPSDEGRLSRTGRPDGIQESRSRILDPWPGRAQIFWRQEPRRRHRHDQSDHGRHEQMFADEKYSKSILAKYTRQCEAEILDQTYRFALDIYVKDPTVTASSIQPIVQQAAEWQQIDAKLAASTPTSAYYDNSYIEEIKKSGFFAQLWR